MPAPSHSGAGARSTMSLRRSAPLFAFALACYLIAPWMGLDSRNVDPRIAEVWPPGGVGFARTPPRWLRAGDHVTIKVQGVGELSNPVVAEQG